MSEEACVHCGAEPEEHYDGSYCPVGPDTYSATQTYEPAATKEPEAGSERARRYQQNGDAYLATLSETPL